jgi:hypothetical protein
MPAGLKIRAVVFSARDHIAADSETSSTISCKPICLMGGQLARGLLFYSALLQCPELDRG